MNCLRTILKSYIPSDVFFLKKQRVTLAFLIVFFVFLIWNIFHISFPKSASSLRLIGNEASHIELLRAIVIEGRLDFKNLADSSVYKGKRYSNKPPGFCFLLSVPYWIYTKVTGDITRNSAIVFIKYCNALFSALSVSLVLIYLSTYKLRMSSIIFGVIAVGFGTIYPAYSVLANSNSLSILLIILALVSYRFFKKVPDKTLFWKLSLLFSSYAFTVDYVNVFFLFPLMLAILWDAKKQHNLLLYFAIGSIPLLLLAVYNYIAFDNPFQLSYSHYAPPSYVLWQEEPLANFAFKNIPRGLYGFLFSLSRGVFILSPVCILGAIMLPYLYFKKKQKLIVPALMLFSGIAINSSFILWHGGHCVGYRYVLAGAIILAMLSSFFFNESRSVAVKSLAIFVLLFSSFNGIGSYYIQSNGVLVGRTWKKEPLDVHANFYTELTMPQFKIYRKWSSTIFNYVSPKRMDKDE